MDIKKRVELPLMPVTRLEALTMPYSVERTLKASRVSYINAPMHPSGDAVERCRKYTPRADIQCLALTEYMKLVRFRDVKNTSEDSRFDMSVSLPSNPFRGFQSGSPRKISKNFFHFQTTSCFCAHGSFI